MQMMIPSWTNQEHIHLPLQADPKLASKAVNLESKELMDDLNSEWRRNSQWMPLPGLGVDTVNSMFVVWSSDL